MSWSRIKGIAVQDLYISKREVTVWFDLVIMAVMSVIVFGFLARYLTGAGSTSANAGKYVIMGMILWETVRVNQYCVAVNSLWNVWSSNLSNIFIAPISLSEYILGNCLVAFIKSTFVAAILCLFGAAFFDFNVLSLGITNVIFIFINLMIFAWALGFLLLGLVFRFGQRVQALAWGAIFFVQPLTAVYYPVAVLPHWVRFISWCIPSTYSLEAARRAVDGSGVQWHLHAGAGVLNVLWVIVGISAFSWLFSRSRITGQFARNDG